MSLAYRFPPGMTVVEPEALAALNVAHVGVVDLLLRHLRGDWGEVPGPIRQHNETAVSDTAVEGSLFSLYTLSTGRRIWLITDADRARTRVLLFTKGESRA